MSEKRPDNFMIIERWLLRMYAVLSVIGVLTITIMFVFNDLIKTIASILSWFFISALFALIGGLILSIVQIIRYAMNHNDHYSKRRIKNSLIVLFTSPISIFLYWLIAFVMLLSMASCS